MTTSGTGKLTAYVLLGGAMLLLAELTARPELAVAAVPFLVAVILGLALHRATNVQVTWDLESDRVLEGETTELTFTVAADARLHRLVIEPQVSGLECRPGRLELALRAAEPAEATAVLQAGRWGLAALDGYTATGEDELGLVANQWRARSRRVVRVYPGPALLRRLVRPQVTQPLLGTNVARARGDGIEFADVREFARPDSPRRINWRVTARSRVLQVNEFHPERQTDVVLFLDTFGEFARGGETTLDATVRAAAALAQLYLRHRDRVGVIGFGGVLRWLLPGFGAVQGYRIVESLLETETVFSYAWKDLVVVPTRSLPSGALVLALSPLLDERTVGALSDLRGRGFDLGVIEIGAGRVMAAKGEVGRLGERIWRLRREALRERLLAAGVAVVKWDEGQPLELALEEMSAWRRLARLA